MSQKNDFKKINTRNVLDDLKENISESNPYLNYFKNIFNRKRVTPSTRISLPVAPTSSVKKEEEYIERLNQVLADCQDQLNKFISNLDIKLIKRNMSLINFIPKPPKHDPDQNPKLKIQTPVQITDPNPDLTKNIPTPDKPPINTIFESDVRVWRERSNKLEEIMKIFINNITTYLQGLSKDIGYIPTQKNFSGLIHEFSKFPNLTPQTRKRIRVRLHHFLISYNQLNTWLKFFKREEDRIRRAVKKEKPF